MNTDILVSIVIPVKNGDLWLEKLFRKLMQQTLFAQSEIIVIDSGSNDRSLDIIKQFPVRLIEIPAQDFNHGETRNLGVQEAKGKYVVMTVQDAVPASELWLQHLISGFVDDNVAGVCGNQIVPHELDKNPVLWYRPWSKPGKVFYHYNKPEDFLQLSPVEKRQAAGWDNVTSAYRRDILLKHPFAKIDFAEDVCWAKEMLVKGHKLCINSEAMVYHYHHHKPEFVLSRYFFIFYYEYKIFGLLPSTGRPVFRHILSASNILLKETKVSWPAKAKWLVFNIRYWIALKKTIRIFNRALNKGEQALDDQFKQTCKKIPQAPKY